MKVLTFNLKRVYTCAVLCLMSVALLSSCKKDDPYDFKDVIPAYVNYINASPDAGETGLYIENILRTRPLVAYGNTSGYVKTFLGEQEVSVKTADENTLISSRGQFDANANYTVFLAGQNTALGIVKITDDLTAPTSGKAKIRFVNVSPNAASVNLLVNNSALVSNQAYRTYSDYFELTAGSYSLTVASGNTRSAVVTTSFQSGKVYTVYAQGMVGGSATAGFMVKTFVNN